MRTPFAPFPALALWLLCPAPALAQQAPAPPLIPRAVLFGNPERTAPRLSGDGKRLAWLAPDKNNVLQVYTRTLGADDAKAVTADRKRGIRRYQWAPDGRTLLYLQDQEGDENWHLYGVDLQGGNVRDYTPFQGVRADLIGEHPDVRDQVLVQLNLRKRDLMDVYRLTLSSGALTLDTENPGDVAAFIADHKLQVRAAAVTTPSGGTELRVRATTKAPWRAFLQAGPEEILAIQGFTPDGQGLYLSSSLQGDTARLVERPLTAPAGAKERVIAASPDADLADVARHPRSGAVQAAAFAPDRTRWTVVDPAVQADFAALAKLAEGDLRIISRDDADRTWLVAFDSDRGPQRFFSWDRKAQKGTFLFSSQPRLEGLPLQARTPVLIKSRDGLDLHGYLTLPAGASKGLPMVLLVHGGPWARDVWAFDAVSQWLVNRGYATLQVNYRGSTGYGKKFLAASFRQWGKAMHTDLLDAVAWAGKQGIDTARVAIMGGSYGGYAALAGVTLTPDTFACAVDIVGPSNIATLLASIPPYWKPIQSSFRVRIGDINDPRDQELLREASPLFKADRIKRPLLIGQGQNDPRVKPAESEQIVAAIKKSGGRVTYVLYPDEGHGFARPENRLDFYGRTEGFLQSCLGGRSEPLAGERQPGATAVVQVISPPAR